jgi:hypothetical protein
MCYDIVLIIGVWVFKSLHSDSDSDSALGVREIPWVGFFERAALRLTRDMCFN